MPVTPRIGSMQPATHPFGASALKFAQKFALGFALGFALSFALGSALRLASACWR